MKRWVGVARGGELSLACRLRRNRRGLVGEGASAVLSSGGDAWRGVWPGRRATISASFLKGDVFALGMAYV